VCAVGADSAEASEGFFGYMYTADVLPKGKGEWELWLTPRWNKGDVGKFSATDLMVGYEHGVTDRFTVAFYLQGFKMDATNAWPPDAESGEFVYPERVDSTKLAVYKSEFKYNFLSPYKEGWGFTISTDLYYVRWYPKVDGARTNQLSLEPRFIVQKNFLDDSLITTANLLVESEWRQFPESGAFENEFSINFHLGASYRFARNLYGGVEGRYHQDILNGEKNHSDYFVGPSLLFSQKRWYVSLSYLRQVHGNPTWSGYPVDPLLYPNVGYHFEEDTKNELRIKLGFAFGE